MNNHAPLVQRLGFILHCSSGHMPLLVERLGKANLDEFGTSQITGKFQNLGNFPVFL